MGMGWSGYGLRLSTGRKMFHYVTLSSLGMEEERKERPQNRKSASWLRLTLGDWFCMRGRG